jgi:hypothetical protein
LDDDSMKRMSPEEMRDDEWAHLFPHNAAMHVNEVGHPGVDPGR